jgi:hypothetical protein
VSTLAGCGGKVRASPASKEDWDPKEQDFCLIFSMKKNENKKFCKNPNNLGPKGKHSIYT